MYTVLVVVHVLNLVLVNRLKVCDTRKGLRGTTGTLLSGYSCTSKFSKDPNYKFMSTDLSLMIKLMITRSLRCQ
eukprot:SAG11_NODE_170_length_13624_cov_40.078226_12_plen_74_part_00